MIMAGNKENLRKWIKYVLALGNTAEAFEQFLFELF